MAEHILAIDQGTTSSRAIIFDHSGSIVSSGQREHEQILPRPGWVEHDPIEIWGSVREVVSLALARGNLTHRDIAAVGITNQRETTVVWDRTTGRPVYNAIVWQDTRTQRICDDLAALGGGVERYKERVGLPLATYFSGPKIRWILDNVEGAREKAERGELAFGNTDAWVLWNMTGGVGGGVHATDVTNASRTMLMDLATLTWDEEIAQEMGVPMEMLPEIRSSAEVYGIGHRSGMLPEVPIAAILGDQQAATFGQACFEPGAAKNTYGTGSFMLLNTGTDPIQSKNGLLTTVCYKIGARPQVYALEGSIAMTGSLVQWLRDNLGFVSEASEIEQLAATVADNGGAYFVPAFSGLFAPHWRPDARGALVGLTRYVNRGHIARAALEAAAFQTREVIDAMYADSGVRVTELKVDGGMVANNLLMQIQADILGVPVVRPKVAETTALGAAYAAGIAADFWQGEQDVIDSWVEDRRWEPSWGEDARERTYRNWKKAVTRTFDWVDADTEQ
jgi:glycerol kinase